MGHNAELAATAGAFDDPADDPFRSFAPLDLGGDTDTVAAVTGELPGAVYGIAGIPMRWTMPGSGRVRRRR